jgi:hypothetical protein
VPSWTDRILFKPSKMIRQTHYNRVEHQFSDHRPVLGLFDVITRKTNTEVKNQLMEQCVAELKKGNGVNTIPVV